MGGLIIEAAAVLNEDNPEFFDKLMKDGVDAVEPEMKRQQVKRDREQLLIDFNEFIMKWCGNNRGHLIDSDDNDGEKFRDKIRKFALHESKDDNNVKEVAE